MIFLKYQKFKFFLFFMEIKKLIFNFYHYIKNLSFVIFLKVK